MLNPTAVVPFTYAGTNLRTLTIDNEPWFVAADVARLLEYSATSAMTRRLDDDDKGVRDLHTLGGVQQMITISEPGFYAAILGSQCAGAKAIKRWLTHDVLPAIRKAGSYSISTVKAELPDRKALARMVIESEEAREQAEARVAELAPRAALADDFLIADGGARLVREVAKLLDMKEKDLRRFLLDEHLIFAKHAPCGVIQYDHYAQFADHFKASEHVINHTHGICTHYTLHILPRGIELIQKRRNARQDAA